MPTNSFVLNGQTIAIVSENEQLPTSVNTTYITFDPGTTRIAQNGAFRVKNSEVYPVYNTDGTPRGVFFPSLGTMSTTIPDALRGTNISGQDSGGSVFAFTPEDTFKYFKGKGVKAHRLTFRHERMQPTPGGALVEPYTSRYANLVDYSLRNGGYPIIDPHNFGRYLVGSTFDDFSGPTGGTEAIIGQDAGYTSAQFADFWVKLSSRFADSRCIYNLMNEPHDQVTATLTTTLNASIAAIRNAGRKNLILVPFNGYSNRYGFISDQTAQAAHLNAIVDSGNNWAIDYHCYVDAFSAGQSTSVQANFIADVEVFTTWCRANNKKAFVGEFGVANDDASLQAAQTFFRHIESNPDVWIGYTWWTAVNYQDSYLYQLLPTELTGGAASPPYTDRKQMDFLEGLLATGQAPVYLTAPSISGTANVGQTLTATSGVVVAKPLTSVSRQWYRGTTPIPGATNDTYVLTVSDLGFTITVREVQTNIYGSVSSSSNPTSVVIDITTWDPLNKSTGVTSITNGNLTVSSDGSGQFPVIRATKGATSGKKYFEVLVNWAGAGANNSQVVGLVNANLVLDGTALSGPNALGLSGDGGIYGNNSGLGGLGVAFAKGDTVCVAVDYDNDRVWFRLNGGNWNNSGTANPATNVGGISIAFLGSGVLYPVTEPYFATHTGNFGATAYTQTVPSGFSNY